MAAATNTKQPAGTRSNDCDPATWSTYFVDVTEQLKPSVRALEDVVNTNWRAPGLPGGTELVAAKPDKRGAAQTG